MLRLLGLMPSIEPSEAELQEARILEQTGYTSQTIEGFKQQIREREAQLRSQEERLTTTILLLQKERDEALLGAGVGLAKGAPLPPGQDAATPAEQSGPVTPAESAGLSLEQAHHYEQQAQQYEQQIQSLTAHIHSLQLQLQPAPQLRYERDEDDGPELSQLQQPSSPSDSGALVRELSAQLNTRQQEIEALRSEKEAAERHLAGVLASPAITKASSPPSQYPPSASAADWTSRDDTESSHDAIHLHAELHALRRTHEAALEQLRESEERLQESNRRLEEADVYSQQLRADLAQQTYQLQHQHESIEQMQQAAGGAAAYTATLDAEVQRLQAELLHLQSIQQSTMPPPSSDASVVDLQRQLHQMHQQLEAQTAGALEEKRQTQAMLQTKLGQVQKVIASKDALIRQLQGQVQQLQQQSQPQDLRPDPEPPPSSAQTSPAHSSNRPVAPQPTTMTSTLKTAATQPSGVPLTDAAAGTSGGRTAAVGAGQPSRVDVNERTTASSPTYDALAGRINQQLAPELHLSIKQQQQLCDYFEDGRLCQQSGAADNANGHAARK